MKKIKIFFTNTSKLVCVTTFTGDVRVSHSHHVFNYQLLCLKERDVIVTRGLAAFIFFTHVTLASSSCHASITRDVRIGCLYFTGTSRSRHAFVTDLSGRSCEVSVTRT